MAREELNVLIIGDTLITGKTEAIFKVDRVPSGKEALDTLDLHAYHLFFSNSGEDGQVFRQVLREKGINAPLFILVEETKPPAGARELHGDENTMEIPLSSLPPAIFHLLARFARLHRENGEMQRQLAERNASAVEPHLLSGEPFTFRDSLTGLYNRAYFLDKLARLDNDRNCPVSIILGDMNGLALVNDAFGYREGDRLLQEVAQALQRCCSKGEIIARWSGDAFAVLLPKRSQQETLTVMETITAELAKAGADPVGPSVSFGCATQEDDSQDLHDLLQTAEMEMHHKKMWEGKDFCDTIIASLVHALGKKDYETEEHTWRMQNLAFKLGGVFGLEDSQFEELVLAVTLHDVGKLAVPEHILMKPGALTDEEWEIIKGHSERGYRIALSSSELSHSAPYILSHHERWDGRGYPQGLRQEEIPLISRIISVIDAYDVMVNGRPYRKGMAQQEAIAELRRCAGSQFDPRLVEMFIRVLQGQENGIF